VFAVLATWLSFAALGRVAAAVPILSVRLLLTFPPLPTLFDPRLSVPVLQGLAERLPRRLALLQQQLLLVARLVRVVSPLARGFRGCFTALWLRRASLALTIAQCTAAWCSRFHSTQ